MTSSDFSDFSHEFNRLYAALGGYKQSPSEAAARLDAYFHALKAIPLRDVIAKADAWLATETKFPKPAEWAHVVTRKDVEVPVMTDDQARDYRDAETHGYERPPCRCGACREAGVDEKPQRFVPEVDADDRDRKMRDPLGQRIVTAGRWIHGAELAGWYRARGDFWNRCAELGLLTGSERQAVERKPFRERLEALFHALPGV